jgi:hypothetical protein
LRYSGAAIAAIATLVFVVFICVPATADTIRAIPISITPVPTQGSAAEGAMPYEKFTDGATAQHGLFTVWRKAGKVSFEIAPTQLDTNYLMVPTLVNGVDASKFLVSGIPFGSWLIQFHKAGDRIVTTEQNPYGKARPNSAAALSVASSYPPSVISADPITAIDKATGNIVFPADVFLSDIIDFTNGINFNTSNPQAHYNLSSRLSYFGPTKAFPKNVELESDLTMSSSVPDNIDVVPDARSLFLRVHYSLLELPDENYHARLADDRMGYFLTARRQYDNYKTDTSFVRYINRWRVEKADPTARVSPAKNPIVFYLLDEVPDQYRAPLRDAMLEWNKAFEAIGITHAIEVRQQPADPNWDPDDARYSIVRWATTDIPAFGAAGPSITNPLTGEIFRGEVIMDANIARSFGVSYNEIIQPTTARTPAQDLACQLRDCDFAAEAIQQMSWGFLALSLDGKLASGGSYPDWYVNDGIKSIMLHEFGHTLGLRHNFQSHNVFSLAQVRNKAFTRSHGIVGSVMEYTPVNLSPHGKPQGDFFQTMIGPWDYFQIRYGYQPIAATSTDGEKPVLDSIAAQSTKPELTYATDEDVAWNSGFATDPRAVQFELSNDALSYAEGVLSIDRRLLDSLASRRPLQGRSYADVRRDLVTIMNSWGRYTLFATRYIGAEHFTRNHRGDPNAKIPFTPVARADERRAYELLDKYAFSDNAMRLSPTLLNSAGDSRFSHWETDVNGAGRLDFPYEEGALVLQSRLLRLMFQPAVLSRLVSLESRTTSRGQTMSISDLYDWTDSSIYGDLSRGGLSSVNSIHRALQHRYAEMLAHILLKPDPGTPSDARALARYHLASLSERITATMHRNNLDEVTTANLLDIRTLADRAISAQITIPPQ